MLSDLSASDGLKTSLAMLSSTAILLSSLGVCFTAMMLQVELQRQLRWHIYMVIARVLANN
ncbi:MAG: hypothetical protein ACJA0M_001487 [Chitinophagales bacterium]|jgi:hypothetical protein